MTREQAIEAARVEAARTGAHQEVYRSAARGFGVTPGGYDVTPRMHGQPLGRSTVLVVGPDEAGAWYDYDVQAWIVRGVVARCGHRTHCPTCYACRHAGEAHRPADEARVSALRLSPEQVAHLDEAEFARWVYDASTDTARAVALEQAHAEATSGVGR